MTTQEENLIAWLTDPRTPQYFGRGYEVRAAVLAHLIRKQKRGSLVELARVHGVTKQTVYYHAKRARLLYGFE